MSTADQPLHDISHKTINHVHVLQEKLSQSHPHLFRKDDMTWEKLLGAAQIVELPADMLVMRPSSPCTQFMLIIEGSVRVYQQSPNDREVTLYRTHCGELCVMSINGMLHARDFGAFAKTENRVIALTLSRDQFMKAMASLPLFCEFVLTSLTDRMSDVMQMVETTVFESLDTRLMCLLSRMSRDSSSDTLYLTHQELARELGTSREVISRILKAFERQGCILLKRGAIQITI
jgi:CRP/FNR family transcriptional regulator